MKMTSLFSSSRARPGADRRPADHTTPRRKVGERRKLAPGLDRIAARLADFGDPLEIFMCGVGGSGMSGIARMLHRLGHRVRGSDSRPSPATEALTAMGIKVHRDQQPENITDEPVDLFIRSAAVPEDHPELSTARARGVPEIKYAGALGLLMEAQRGIAIAGTHGKTTTTAMTALILAEAGLDPSMVVGGDVPVLGGSTRAGRGQHLVAEACEFDRSFLELCPEVAVITNIEADHLDYFRGGLPEIIGAFGDFLDLLPSGGATVANMDDPAVRRAVRRARVDGVRVVGFGCHKSADFRASRVDLAEGRPRFQLTSPASAEPVVVELGVSGLHNVQNALAAAAAAWAAAGVDAATSAGALSRFDGVKRRFQILTEGPRLAVVDDFAHHPTAVEAVLRTARQRWPSRRLWAIFQPHQFCRTRIMLDDFATALSVADRVILPEIYFARDTEADRRSVSSADLARRVADIGVEAHFEPSFPAIASRLIEDCGPSDAVVVMGAGDIWQLAHILADQAALTLGGDASQTDQDTKEEDDGDRLVA